MNYTARFAHLSLLPAYKEGDIVLPGQLVGKMGNTGQSKWPHLHIDVVEGYISHIIRLSEIGYEKNKMYTPNIQQLNYFIDIDLFHYEPYVTSYFYDPAYKIIFDKDHPAYDVVPENRKRSRDHYGIYWNRTKKGFVLGVGYDEWGYGNYLLVGFEA